MPEQEITYIDHQRDTAGLAVLVKRGRKYLHLKYVFNNPNGMPATNGWTDQVEIGKLTIVDGFYPEVVQQYRKLALARQDWERARQDTLSNAHYLEKDLAYQRAIKRMDTWIAANPEPKREDFIKDVNHA